jgi:hypothetical protein
MHIVLMAEREQLRNSSLFCFIYGSSAYIVLMLSQDLIHDFKDDRR